MKITEHGAACCCVILGENATWLETHAAQELCLYIQKISGARLLLAREREAASLQDPGWKAGYPWDDSRF